MSVATLRAIERHAVVTALGPYRFVLPGPPSAAARVRG